MVERWRRRGPLAGVALAACLVATAAWAADPPRIAGSPAATPAPASPTKGAAQPSTAAPTTRPPVPKAAARPAATKNVVRKAVLEVHTVTPGVPVELTGEVKGFGLTPFQLRDMPVGDYLLRVSSGEFAPGASRLHVRATPAGQSYEVGSLRGGLLLRSAVLPGLGQLESNQIQRGCTALAQTALAAARTWSAHQDYKDATDVLKLRLAAYESETDAQNLASRRTALLQASGEVSDLHTSQLRWIGVTAWAYGCNLLDLYLDARPVAEVVAAADGASGLALESGPASRSQALLRSALHPGSGHYALDHRWRGLAFEMLSTAGVFASLRELSDTDAAKRDFTIARQDYSSASEDGLAARRTAMQSAFDDYSRARNRRNAVLLSTGAVWALGLLDVMWSEPGHVTPDFGTAHPGGLSLHAEPAGAGVRLSARF